LGKARIRTYIHVDGKYFIIVTDEKNQAGKYSLTVETIEDFSEENIFVILPKSWYETKIFFNDYISIIISFLILTLLVIIPITLIIKKIKKIQQASKIHVQNN